MAYTAPLASASENTSGAPRKGMLARAHSLLEKGKSAVQGVLLAGAMSSTLDAAPATPVQPVYTPQQTALIWLIKQGATGTPEKTDDTPDAMRQAYNKFLEDLKDGKLSEEGSLELGLLGDQARKSIMTNASGKTLTDAEITALVTNAIARVEGSEEVVGAPTTVAGAGANSNSSNNKPTTLAPLNETKEEKGERIEKEKILEKINKKLMTKDSWMVDKDKSGDAKISVKDKAIIIEYKSKNSDTLNPEGTVNCLLQLPSGGYEIDLDSTGAVPVIYLYDSSEGRIDQSGNPTKDRINLKVRTNKLFVPSNCAKLLISISVNKVSNPIAEIRSIKIRADGNMNPIAQIAE